MIQRKKLTKLEWLEINGFSGDGVSYLVLGNSYPIKDALKEAGFKFSNLLRWHGSNCNFELPEGCFYKELHYDEVFTWNEEDGITYMKDGARETLELIFNPPIESDSEWVGEIGDRLQDVPVIVRNITGYDSAYGYKYVYTLEDEEGNLYTWFTTSQQAVARDTFITFSGRIKAHVKYKGAKTTQMTRCKFSQD